MRKSWRTNVQCPVSSCQGEIRASVKTNKENVFQYAHLYKCEQCEISGFWKDLAIRLGHKQKYKNGKK